MQLSIRPKFCHITGQDNKINILLLVKVSYSSPQISSSCRASNVCIRDQSKPEWLLGGNYTHTTKKQQ